MARDRIDDGLALAPEGGERWTDEPSTGTSPSVLGSGGSSVLCLTGNELLIAIAGAGACGAELGQDALFLFLFKDGRIDFSLGDGRIDGEAIGCELEKEDAEGGSGK